MLLDKRPEVIAAGKRRLKGRSGVGVRLSFRSEDRSDCGKGGQKGRSGILRQPSLVRLGNFGSLFCVSYRGA